MNKNRIRLTESQLHQVIKESVKRVLNEDSLITFNWTLRVSPKNAAKAYDLLNKIEHTPWVEDFEHSEEKEETQCLSIHPNAMNESIDYDNIEDIPDDILHNEFVRMLAYRCPRGYFGDEYDKIVDELKSRGILSPNIDY